MPTEQSKLYRSNIQFHPITINGSPHLNESTDYCYQSRQLSPQKNLYHQSSQKSIKLKHQMSTQQNTKQILPYINMKQIQNTSFISIDESYLDPRFSKPIHQKNSRAPNKHFTELQSDTESIGGRSIRTYQGQDQYYKYWKTKAHQYLDQNFKLREQNKKLKTQLQSIQKEKINQKPQIKKDSSIDDSIKKGQKSFLYLQSIFKKKLNELQDQVKEKNQKIINLEDKLLELNRKVLGQEERTQLIERLGKQIDTLNQENISFKKQSYQYKNQQRQNNFQTNDEKIRSPYGRYRSKQKTIYGNNRRSSQKNLGKIKN